MLYPIWDDFSYRTELATGLLEENKQGHKCSLSSLLCICPSSSHVTVLEVNMPFSHTRMLS